MHAAEAAPTAQRAVVSIGFLFGGIAGYAGNGYHRGAAEKKSRDGEAIINVAPPPAHGVVGIDKDHIVLILDKMRFADLPKEQQDKVIGDVFCIQCQKSFRLEHFVEREFRGMLMIEGKCPQCGSALAKPVSTGAAATEHREK